MAEISDGGQHLKHELNELFMVFKVLAGQHLKHELNELFMVFKVSVDTIQMANSLLHSSLLTPVIITACCFQDAQGMLGPH